MELHEIKSITPKILHRSVGSRHLIGWRKASDVAGITLHTPAGYNTYNWFLDPRSQSATTAGVTWGGDIEVYYDYRAILPANSNKWANIHTLSIEFADNNNPEDSVRTDILYENGGKYIAYLIARFNLGRKAVFNQNIFLHKQFAKDKSGRELKSCPGNLDYERLIRIANKYLDQLFTEIEKKEKEQIKIETILSEETLPITKKEMPTSFLSRKFLLTVAAIVLGLLQGYLTSTGKGELPLEDLLTAIALYVGFEGGADVVGRYRQGQEIYKTMNSTEMVE